MPDPQPQVPEEAVEAAFAEIEHALKNYGPVDPRFYVRAALEAALPIERKRWEEEVRERLLSEETIHSLTQEIVEGSFGEVISLPYITVKDAVSSRVASLFPDTEEGHVCDSENPCEPNDHLCRRVRADTEEGR